MNGPTSAFDAYLNEIVVVDTTSRYVYLGRLSAATPLGLVLTDVDVHDLQDGTSSRDVYVLQARNDGVRENRGEVTIRADMVVSVSRLADVIQY